MIFASGFCSFLFATFAAAVLGRMGIFHSTVHRWSDWIVLIPGIGGMLAMLWSLCVVLARFLP